MFRPQQIFPEYFFSYRLQLNQHLPESSEATGNGENPVRKSELAVQNDPKSGAVVNHSATVSVNAAYRFPPFSFIPSRNPATKAILRPLRKWNSNLLSNLLSAKTSRMVGEL